jgi:hypothetical protein
MHDGKRFRTFDPKAHLLSLLAQSGKLLVRLRPDLLMS